MSCSAVAAVASPRRKRPQQRASGTPEPHAQAAERGPAACVSLVTARSSQRGGRTANPVASRCQARVERVARPGRRPRLGPVAWRCESYEHVFVRSTPSLLHADLDAFFASVEQRDDPRLRGRPVIVGGGVVLAASYEAKAFGVRTAMGGRKARQLCPRAIVVSPRMEAYSEASKAMFGVFENTTPLVEGLSIDEAFLDVRGMRRIAGEAAEIAARLRREVRECAGLPITV